MQQEGTSCADDLGDSNNHLRFPRLPYADIDALLTTSRQLHRGASDITMSSVTDDSSVDDNVSSIGQEEWEKITPDYDSDVAAHEDISRMPTPLVDVQELQQTVLVFPPPLNSRQQQGQEQPQQVQLREPEQHLTSSVECDDADQLDDEVDDEEEQAYREEGEGIVDNTEDIMSYWENVEDFQITFDEKKLKARDSKEQDVMLPLVKIVGATAECYTAGTEWRDLDHVAGVVRMRLGQGTLRLRRPLKLLYFGDESLQGALEAKIGSALVSARDDREIANKRHVYNVLPVSWDRESPQVELMPDSGANMDVETCILARRGGAEQIEIVLQSGETIKSWREGMLSSFTTTRGYQLPDLALFHISEMEETDTESWTCAQELLQRHGIPTIIVSSSGSWDATDQQLGIDTRSPHFGVQLPGQSTSEARVFRRMPIDTDTFLRLNSLQLNRNMACMISGDRTSAKRSLGARCSHAAQKLEETLFLSGFAKILLALSLICMMLSAFVVSNLPSVRYEATALASGSSIVGAETVATLSRSTQSTVASVTPKVTPSITSSVALIEPFPKDLIAHIPTYEPNYSKAFEAQVFGDNFVIVKPPKWFADLRKAPELVFTIIKEEQAIDHNTTRLHERIYALEIPREHAYGIVDLHIQTKETRKQAFAVNQTVQIDLGSAWVKLFDWLKVTNGIVASDRKGGLSPEIILNSTRWLWEAATKVPRNYADQQREWLRAATAKMVRGWQRADRDEERAGRTVRREARREAIRELKAGVKQTVDQARRDIHRWRETHLQREQKQLLKLWWRLSGKLPSDQQTKRFKQHMGKHAGRKARK